MPAMRNLVIALTRPLPIAFALMRGAVELASLQRWRIKSWLAREP
jgi:hypothetical protein